MKIRSYSQGDNQDLFKLFYNTVHYINCRDYDKSQLDSWAKLDTNIDSWCEKFSNTYTIVIEMNNKIVGFSNIDSDGLIDMFFVHKDYQNIGVATKLLINLIEFCKSKNIESISVNASITARGFFKKNGFLTISQNQIKVDNLTFTNYTMKKTIK